MVRLVVVVRVEAGNGDPSTSADTLIHDGFNLLLTALEVHPAIHLAISAPPSTWEELSRRHPDSGARVAGLASSGQVELLAGPLCDVVLAGVPRVDRIGQIEAGSDAIETLFGQRPRCGWVPHQVWEPGMADDLVAADLDATILLPDPTVTTRSAAAIRSGWFHTESDGRLLSVLPADETLAHWLAEGRVDDVPGHLEETRHQLSDGPVVIVDHWLPATSNGKRLVRLLKWLVADAGLQLSTPETALRETRSHGRFSLPAAGKPGGSWRLERDRHPVAARLHARMLALSARLERARRVDTIDDQQLRTATSALYHVQGYLAGSACGVPDAQSLAAGRRGLLEAERLADRLDGHAAGWVDVSAADFALNGGTEVRLQSERLTAWVDPVATRGLFELDIRDIGLSLPLRANQVREGESPIGGGGPEACLLAPGASRQDFIDGIGCLLKLVPCDGRYSLDRRGAEAWLAWDSDPLEPGPRLDWRMGLQAGEGGCLLFRGRVSGLKPHATCRLAVVLPLGTGATQDSYGYDRQGRTWDLGSLDSLDDCDGVGLIEESTGVDWSVNWSPAAPAWTVPGVSYSLVVPHWHVTADEEGRWSFCVNLSVDTSAAQARTLGLLSRKAA